MYDHVACRIETRTTGRLVETDSPFSRVKQAGRPEDLESLGHLAQEKHQFNGMSQNRFPRLGPNGWYCPKCRYSFNTPAITVTSTNHFKKDPGIATQELQIVAAFVASLMFPKWSRPYLVDWNLAKMSTLSVACVTGFEEAD